MPNTPQRIVIIGGHGKIALLLAPLLVRAGHHVTSVVRNPAHAEDVNATGAHAVVTDISTLDSRSWDDLISDADVIVWSAGAGGKGGPETTYAVDRDAAIASIAAAARQDQQPRYLMVSFVESLTGNFPPEHPLHHYAVAKRAADEYLLAHGPAEAIILGPTVLNDEPAGGVHTFDSTTTDSWEAASRELVAQVIAAAIEASELPKKLEFCDGTQPVAELF